MKYRPWQCYGSKGHRIIEMLLYSFLVDDDDDDEGEREGYGWMLFFVFLISDGWDIGYVMLLKISLCTFIIFIN